MTGVPFPQSVLASYHCVSDTIGLTYDKVMCCNPWVLASWAQWYCDSVPQPCLMVLEHCLFPSGEHVLAALVSNEVALFWAKVFLAFTVFFCFGDQVSIAVTCLTQATGNLWMYISSSTWIPIKNFYSMTSDYPPSYYYWNFSLNKLCHIRDHRLSKSSHVMIDQPTLQGGERVWNLFSFYLHPSSPPEH